MRKGVITIARPATIIAIGPKRIPHFKGNRQGSWAIAMCFTPIVLRPELPVPHLFVKAIRVIVAASTGMAMELPANECAGLFGVCRGCPSR